MSLDLEQRYARIDDGRSDHVCTGNVIWRLDAIRRGRRARRNAGLRVRQRLELSPDRRRLPPGDSSRGGQRASMARGRGGLPHATVRIRLRSSRPGGEAPQSRRWRCRLAADDDGAPGADGAALSALLCACLCGLLSRPVAPWSLAAAALFGLLFVERAVAGIVATRRFGDPAALLFPVVHLLRDLAWVAAMARWLSRRVARRAGGARATACNRATADGAARPSCRRRRSDEPGRPLSRARAGAQRGRLPARRGRTKCAPSCPASICWSSTMGRWTTRRRCWPPTASRACDCCSASAWARRSVPGCGVPPRLGTAPSSASTAMASTTRETSRPLPGLCFAARPTSSSAPGTRAARPGTCRRAAARGAAGPGLRLVRHHRASGDGCDLGVLRVWSARLAPADRASSGRVPEVELRLLLHRHGLTVLRSPDSATAPTCGPTTLTPGPAGRGGRPHRAGDRADAAARHRAERAPVNDPAGAPGGGRLPHWSPSTSSCTFRSATSSTASPDATASPSTTR